MNNSKIILKANEGEDQIPILRFVAGWICMSQYYQLGDVCQADDSWAKKRMPLYMPSSKDSGQASFYCLETLCRILSRMSRWSLRDDECFFERNHTIVKMSTPSLAQLDRVALLTWSQADIPIRDQMLADLDGLIFASIAAQDSSQD